MPFSSYSDLQASIGRWLKRNNLSDSAPDFIALAEVRLNSRLRVRQMRTYYTITPSTAFITLPGDYNEAVSLSYGKCKLDFVTESAADPSLQNCDSNAYTIVGNRIKLLTLVDGKTQLTLHYYANLEPLSDTNTSNWLLEDAPNIYLYASLVEAEAFIKNDDRVAGWKAALDTAINDLQTDDMSGQFSGSSLGMRAV